MKPLTKAHKRKLALRAKDSAARFAKNFTNWLNRKPSVLDTGVQFDAEYPQKVSIIAKMSNWQNAQLIKFLNSKHRRVYDMSAEELQKFMGLTKENRHEVLSTVQ